MPKKIDITGLVFNRLTVIEEHGRVGNKITWLCKCECGSTAIINGGHLRSGHTKSCGCFATEERRKRGVIHGMYGTDTYKTWINMLTRCRNSKSADYKNYGGRGILVCSEWESSFESFVKDMGEKPTKKHTIDRINNDLGYFKDNCRWVTKAVNNRNTRKAKWWWINGVRYESLEEAAISQGVTDMAIIKRCLSGKDGYYSELKYPC